MALSTGDKLGRYEILGLLGAGGMGEVYRARDTRLERTVAVKLAHEKFSERFEHEARAIAQLNHRNICTLFDVGPDFLVMEYVDGQTLKQKIASGPLDPDDVLPIAIEIARGLQAAHKRGILHRDIKPDNIMITLEGEVKIMDFGLARLAAAEADDTPTLTMTAPGTILGTPDYMAPEQLRGEIADQRSDIWALGATLYEVLTGQRPFQGTNKLAVMRSIQQDQPRPIRPGKLGVVVMKMLAKDPARRYQDVGELLADLTAGQTGESRPVLPWVLACVAVIAAIAGALYFSKQHAAPNSPLKLEQITAFGDSAGAPTLSVDGRMLAFIRGPSSPGIRGLSTFLTSGEIYVKLLPNGEPVQLTRDNMRKMQPVFSADGSRVAYTVVSASGSWDTWTVPVLGGTPRNWLPNASGLTWIGPSRVLFSEIKTGLHMAIVTATEGRTEERDVYLPPDDRGMAHHSYLSPDGKSVLLVEMDPLGWLPCRAVPFDGSSRGQVAGPKSGHCTSAAWSPDGRSMYFSSDASGTMQIWRQQGLSAPPEQLTFGPAVAEGVAPTPDGKSLITSIGFTQESVWISNNGVERQVSGEGNAVFPAWGDGVARSVFSPDGKKLYYLLQKGAQRGFGSGELSVSDLSSGAHEVVLPGVLVNSFDISRDGEAVVFSSIDDSGVSRMWLARLDRRSPPRRLTSREGSGPVFGRGKTVYFRAPEGKLRYLYEMDLGSEQVRKIIPDPVINAPGTTPDGTWILASLAAAGRDSSEVVKAYSMITGESHVVCAQCLLKWPRDGRVMFLSFGDGQLRGSKMFAISLKPGNWFPKLPPNGITTAEDLRRLPIERVIDHPDVFPGPTASIFGLDHQVVHRNLYRLILP